MGVFLLTGLALRLEDARAAFRAKAAALYGVLATLVLSPLLALPLMAYAPTHLPALQPAFLKGLALLCCLPTTLTTGVILTQQANANAALTLLLVILTNVLGVFTIPYALSAVFDAAALDPAPLLDALLRTILAPLAVGIALRCACVWGARAARLGAYRRALTRVRACVAAAAQRGAGRGAPGGCHAAVQPAAAAGVPAGHPLDDGAPPFVIPSITPLPDLLLTPWLPPSRSANTRRSCPRCRPQRWASWSAPQPHCTWRCCC